ncbi:valine--tRNA ligase [Candidatus Nomurabacteria bacterium RIFCSPLOWO2_01_FULL_40_18]|uniref:Valine--tRNA ligase n=1 Tax=Candidatus Nomurabacteria bacterium RIFCSPLOWO2_01_FULL_40_18 TaxID=1801773 RepID=A0A1F6XJB6_9BACT|nr:MAG: valine--tRNA ligase [Candidatus Nomurabacteria bacterium RIFCSPLOWO2_01_FULL_40_18]
MDGKLLKPYNPKETEDRIYKLWEDSGFFAPESHPPWVDNPKENSNYGKYFSIVLPPPNVTGNLHTGHALTLVIQDIMIRHARMQGKNTLWLPGTDHAAIATQSKVEKLIEKEGLRKNDLGREKFLERVEEFAKESHDTIVNQCKKLGASLDWSREAFTLDETRNTAVKTAFKKMYEDGLIYRGNRIVNWDPKGQTVISDDELVYEEKKTKFYTFKYGPFEIGTTRPETKFGDKYVVMHPKDKRYEKYTEGQKIKLEWINGPIEATVVKDEAIDMEFGTGVMTITPWHTAIDFEIAERHKLDKEQIIDKYGKLLPIAGEFTGMKITEAREKIVEKLKTKGLLVSVDKNYVNKIATAERTGGIIEPQIMLQWFVDVNKKIPSRGNKSLKELMLEPVREGKIKIIPSHFEKVYFNWIENLRDWCISRQIWYGHRIPVFYKGDKIEVGENPGEGWTQDEDTLDTWFSSGLWTFSTLGWPNKTEDLKNYHPTTVLETGHDILFFWIARMILMSQYLLGEIPFKNVYLHGMVRTADGKKMSKSLGDKAVDPLDIIKKYGNDALRMAMIVGNTPGTDLKLNENNIRGYGKFANKLWNIARFVLNNSSDASPDPQNDLRKEFDDIVKDMTKDMENYRFHLASEKIYHYIWHRFADEIMEESKKNKEIQSSLIYILKNSLKLLHPFMPFVTEEIWSMVPDKKGLLMVSKWPC